MLCTVINQGTDVVSGINDVDVKLEILDLASFQSIASFAQRFAKARSKVDVLINNAGVLGIPERQETVDGLEMQMGVNHFGTHLLTRLMEPLITDGGRVVFTSSDAHIQAPNQPPTTIDWDNINFEKPGSYNKWNAYGRSKLGNILDSKEFTKRLAGRGINVYAVDPGFVHTEILRNLTDGSFISRMARLFAPITKYLIPPALKGSLTTLRCAVDPALGSPEYTGKYWCDMREEPASELASDPAVPPRYWKITEDILEQKLGKKVDELLEELSDSCNKISDFQ